VIVDCAHVPYPFDERLDYSRFVAYYPVSQIAQEPSKFVRCLRTLRKSDALIREMRLALKDAREWLIYGWWLHAERSHPYVSDSPDVDRHGNNSHAAPGADGTKRAASPLHASDTLRKHWNSMHYGRVLDNLLINVATPKHLRNHPKFTGGVAGGGGTQLAGGRMRALDIHQMCQEMPGAQLAFRSTS
jgi:hypothetical protein